MHAAFKGSSFKGIVNCNDGNFHIHHDLFNINKDGGINLSLLYTHSERDRNSAFGYGVFLNHYLKISYNLTNITTTDYSGAVFTYEEDEDINDLYHCKELSSKLAHDRETITSVITDCHGNQFHYSSKTYPDKIVYKDGSVVNFLYNQSGYLSQISNTSESYKITFNYTGDLITSVKYYKFIDSEHVLCKGYNITYGMYNYKSYISKISFNQYYKLEISYKEVELYNNVFSYDIEDLYINILESISKQSHKITFSNNNVSSYINGFNNDYTNGLLVTYERLGLVSTVTNSFNEKIVIPLESDGSSAYSFDSLGNISCDIFNNNILESKTLSMKSHIEELEDAIIKNGHFSELNNWTLNTENVSLVDTNQSYNLYKPVIGEKFLKLEKISSDDVASINQEIIFTGNKLDYYSLLLLCKPYSSRLNVNIKFMLDDSVTKEYNTIISPEQDEDQEPWSILIENIKISESFNKINVTLSSLDVGYVYVGAVELLNNEKNITVTYTNGLLTNKSLGDQNVNLIYNDNYELEFGISKTTVNEYVHENNKLTEIKENNGIVTETSYLDEKPVSIKRKYNDTYMINTCQYDSLNEVVTQEVVDGDNTSYEYDNIKEVITGVSNSSSYIKDIIDDKVMLVRRELYDSLGGYLKASIDYTVSDTNNLESATVNNKVIGNTFNDMDFL